MIVAKSLPFQKHSGRGINFQFDYRGFFRTDKPFEEDELVKYDGKPGFWVIISKPNTRKYGRNAEKVINNKLKMDAARLGFVEKTGRNIHKVCNEELIDFIKEETNKGM